MHKNGPYRRLLFLILCGLYLQMGSAFSSDKMLDASRMDKTPVSLTAYFDVLEDQNLTLTLADVQKPDIAAKFETNTPAAEALSLGYSRSAYWLRLALRNDSDRPLERMLDINYALLTSVQFHQPDASGSYHSISTGGILPFATRPYLNRNFVFPITLAPNSAQVVYLRLMSIDAILVPARLWEAQAFHVYERNDYNIQSLYFGMVIAMVLFNLLLFIALRDVIYLLYVSFIICAALTLSAQNGLAHEFMWPEATHWSNVSNFIGFAISQVTLIIFMRHMLLTWLTFPKLDRLLKFFMVLQLLAAIGLFLLVQTLTQPAVLLNLATAPLILGTGLYCAVKRQRSAYFFVVAFVILILGGVMTILRAYGLLSTNMITTNGLQFGSALEMVLLAFALADRFNVIRREKAYAQQDALEAQHRLVETLKTSERELEARVEERTAELRIAATAFESHESTVVTDASGVIMKVNPAFIETTGYSAKEAVGQKMRILKSGRHDAAFYAAMWESITSTGTWQGEIWNRHKNGEVYPKWLTITAVKGDDGVVTHYVGTHQDITERKVAEERIAELAFFDPLTHLPNRTLLKDRLKQAMTAGNRSGNFNAVLFLDLDQFKTLNDTLGYENGDLLLLQAAQRLVSIVREGDTVARLGGDEFVVVLVNMHGTAEETAKQTEIIGNKILADLSRMYQFGDIEYRCTASIGAALFQGHETSIDELLKQAELAMYKSKTSGRNSFHFFYQEMETVVIERVALETGLRKAIQENQLLLHYQAQVIGENSTVTGAEALVRWQHPQRGMVSPAEFIPLAEETGLILPLGLWVLETACVQLSVWSSQPAMEHLTLAVNVSAHQFRQPDFVDQVLAVLKNSGANPQRLKLELTESLLVNNVEDIIKKMSALKDHGVRFSLDDFGTGYSSLSYLKRLPLFQLKIDQSFVRDILVDPNDAAIAKTIVTLAQSLGLFHF
jgi:diguanylate cyclase (GGDEF)-like protein/PAS domain S-box-containing protein